MTRKPDYVVDVAALTREALTPLTPLQVAHRQAFAAGHVFSGFHMICDCRAIEPLCTCPPPPKPSWWRRLFRKRA